MRASCLGIGANRRHRRVWRNCDDTDSAARARAIRRVAESSTYVQQNPATAELFKAALSNNAGAVTTDQPLTLVDYIYEQPR